MGDEGYQEHQRSLAAPLIFLIVVGFQLASRSLDQLKKKGNKQGKEVKLRAEIKRLLKEASSLSQPSTFAQAAKLKRLAAAKEKELANYQDLQIKENDLYLRVLFISKVLTYLALLIWFWTVPVASISHELVQPFGKLLSWRTEGVQNNKIMVGIIPWLIVSTRVSKFICRLIDAK
ncbi:putative WRB/Get1 family protein [Senna tora]|uniref:Putative WRB/Get1 family protein n=1 Tax=Senna tora TaxID=362788 RepID=A0A834W8M3_9FABA|nr:putative WRB/Get1 family protein [Senna tora]